MSQPPIASTTMPRPSRQLFSGVCRACPCHWHQLPMLWLRSLHVFVAMFAAKLLVALRIVAAMSSNTIRTRRDILVLDKIVDTLARTECWERISSGSIKLVMATRCWVVFDNLTSHVWYVMVDKWLFIGLSLCADAGCDFPIMLWVFLSFLFLFVLQPLPALFGGEKNFHFGSCYSLEYLSLN